MEGLPTLKAQDFPDSSIALRVGGRKPPPSPTVVMKKPLQRLGTEAGDSYTHLQVCLGEGTGWGLGGVRGERC